MLAPMSPLPSSPPFAGPLASLFARPVAVLAPMEDVSNLPFRRLCRELGADITVTEFVRAEGLLGSSRSARPSSKRAREDSAGMPVNTSDCALSTRSYASRLSGRSRWTRSSC